MPRRISIDGAAYWGTFLFSALVMTYLLVNLIQLSGEEETRYLDTVNYRQQVRYVTIATSLGSFKIALMRSQAPATTKNFLKLAQSGFYDQTNFYHFPQGIFVESGLVSSARGEENAGSVFKDHVEPLAMTRGLVAMPRRVSEQVDGRLLLFFAEDDLPVASKEYIAFGRIVEGMEVVDRIEGVSPKLNAGVRAPVVLTSITID